MRRFSYFALAFAVFAATPVAAQQESQAAKTTRKTLQRTITIDIKEVGTKDFLEEISGEVDNKIKFKIDNGSGVSNNTKMTYKGKNVTVEKVLNELADKYDWGWYVVSNAGNNTLDGKVMIRKNTKAKERGFENGKEPKSSSLEVPTEPMATADDVKKDLAQLQGEWKIAAMEVNGVIVREERLEGTALTVKDDVYTVKAKKLTTPCKLTLDPAKDPKEVDMLFLEGDNKDRTLKGIYKIDGDTFQLVRGLDPDQNRPRDFATWPDTNYFVLTWKKK